MPQNQAVWLDAPGKQLRVGPADMPKIGPGEVLMRNHAVAINPVDWKIQDTGLLKQSFPTSLGCDLAGEVLDVGEGVEHIHKGDRIAAWSLVEGFELYHAANAKLAGVLPDNISYEEGAVLPVAFMTAIVGLSTEHGNGLGLPLPTLESKPTDKIIVVWGASGSVGAVTTQIAVAGGVKVIAVASEHNFDFCKKAGASQVFDYHSASIVEDVVKAVKDSGSEFAGVYDAVSVTASLDPVEKIIHSLGGGISIVVEPGIPESKLADVKRVFIQGWGPVPEPAWASFFTAALREGKLKPLPRPYVVGKGLESVQLGMDIVKKGVSAQKVVIDLSP